MDSTVSLQAALDGAATGMALVAADGTLSWANRAFCAQFGRESGALRGMAFGDLAHPGDARLCVSVLARLAYDRIAWAALEARFVGGDSRAVWARFDVVAVRDAAGRPTGQLLRFREPGERSPAAVMHFDASGCLAYANGAARDALGVPIGLALGRTPAALGAGAAFAAACERAIAQVLATGETIDIGADRFAGGQAGMVACCDQMAPQRDWEGRVVGVICTAQEGRRMRDAQQRLNTLVESAPDIIARFDLAGRCLYVNPAMARVSGVPAEAFVGRHVEEADTLFPPAQAAVAADLLAAIRRVGADGEPQEVEFAWTFPAGTRHFDMCMVAESDTAGEPVGVLCFVRDITRIKEVEQELRESRERLRQLAAHRDALREEERKRIAREMHDELGQLLTGIRGGLGWIERTAGDDGLRGRVRDLIGLVDDTVRVVRDVAASLRPAALDMGIVAALEWLAGEFSRHTGIACRLRADHNDLRFDDATATALFRIVQESLTNVARHARAGRVEIRLARRGPDVVLEIQDDGKGFDAGADGGNGLGLVGMRERVAMLGGALSISSAPGKGTTVVVAIPGWAMKESE